MKIKTFERCASCGGDLDLDHTCNTCGLEWHREAEVSDNLKHHKPMHFFGWYPCDEGTVLEQVTNFLIGQLECKCCIMLRSMVIGFIIGVILF